MTKQIIWVILIGSSILLILGLCIPEGESILTSANITQSYRILVDVEESKLYLFKGEVLEKTFQCAGGKESTPSPIRNMDYYFKRKMGRGIWWKLARI